MALNSQGAVATYTFAPAPISGDLKCLPRAQRENRFLTAAFWSIPLAFLKVVEVLPPMLSGAGEGDGSVSMERRVKSFTEEIMAIQSYVVMILVANVKRDDATTVDPVQAALLLHEALGVDAAPVIVVRDLNRSRFLSTVLTAVALGLRSAMVAWGDDLRPGSTSSNVRDFPDLSTAIRAAAAIALSVNPRFRILAPVNVEGLSTGSGVKRAKDRLAAGADLLLAQPPTTDDGEAFDRHLDLLRKAGLDRKTCLGVFHFRGQEDVEHYEALFGWRLPRSLHESSGAGESALAEVERRVIGRIQAEGLPGVCVSTRGLPHIAKSLLS